MNPFDFYYLDDFLKFSPLSPNYTNSNRSTNSRVERANRVRT
jgi:hypothetical protein